jgi:hypothetical protein
MDDRSSYSWWYRWGFPAAFSALIIAIALAVASLALLANAIWPIKHVYWWTLPFPVLVGSLITSSLLIFVLDQVAERWADDQEEEDRKDPAAQAVLTAALAWRDVTISNASLGRFEPYNSRLVLLTAVDNWSPRTAGPPESAAWMRSRPRRWEYSVDDLLGALPRMRRMLDETGIQGVSDNDPTGQLGILIDQWRNRGAYLAFLRRSGTTPVAAGGDGTGDPVKENPAATGPNLTKAAPLGEDGAPS